MTPRRGAALGLLMAAIAIALCMLVTPLPGHPVAWVLAAVVGLAAGFSGIAIAIGWRAYRHHRLSRHLHAIGRPTMVVGVKVHELPGTRGAFVAGLVRPQIFCSPVLRADLNADELRAVVLHERFHQLDRAPARLVVLETLEPALNLFAVGRGWLARRVAALEIAADRYAVQQGSSRPALARALLKVSPTGPGALGIGFASATDLRIRALLGDEPERRSGGSVAWLVAPALVAAFCILVVVPA